MRRRGAARNVENSRSPGGGTGRAAGKGIGGGRRGGGSTRRRKATTGGVDTSGDENGSDVDEGKLTIYDTALQSIKGMPWYKAPPVSVGSLTTAVGSAAMEVQPAVVETDIDLSDVGGIDEHVTRVKEALAGLLRPELFQKLGVKPPRGLLFHGPPGTGKTMVVRAIAGYCKRRGVNVTIFIRKGGDILSKYIGEAERQLRLLFEEARRLQPSIIFFDELDGIAPTRSPGRHAEIASVVATLLALMDGVDPLQRVLVIGATNRPDNLDAALRRPGRFDFEFRFDPPTRQGRMDILKLKLAKWEKLGISNFDDEELERLADTMEGYTGADINCVCEEVARKAMHHCLPEVFDFDVPTADILNSSLGDKASEIRVTLDDFEAVLETFSSSKERSLDSLVGFPASRDVVPLFDKALPSIIARMTHAFGALVKAPREGLQKSQHRRCIILSGAIDTARRHIVPLLAQKLELPKYELSPHSIGSASHDGTFASGFTTIFRRASAQPSVLVVCDMSNWWSRLDSLSRATMQDWLNCHPPQVLLVFAVPRGFNFPEDLFTSSEPALHIEIFSPTLEECRGFLGIRYVEGLRCLLRRHIALGEKEETRIRQEQRKNANLASASSGEAQPPAPDPKMEVKTKRDLIDEYLAAQEWTKLPPAAILQQHRQEEAFQVKLQCQIEEILKSLANHYPSLVHCNRDTPRPRDGAPPSLSAMFDRNNRQYYRRVEDFELDIRKFCFYIRTVRFPYLPHTDGGNTGSSSHIGRSIALGGRFASFSHQALHKVHNLDYPEALLFFSTRRSVREKALTKTQLSGWQELQRHFRAPHLSLFPSLARRRKVPYLRTGGRNGGDVARRRPAVVSFSSHEGEDGGDEDEADGTEDEADNSSNDETVLKRQKLRKISVARASRINQEKSSEDCTSSDSTVNSDVSLQWHTDTADAPNQKRASEHFNACSSVTSPGHYQIDAKQRTPRVDSGVSCAEALGHTIAPPAQFPLPTFPLDFPQERTLAEFAGKVSGMQGSQVETSPSCQSAASSGSFFSGANSPTSPVVPKWCVSDIHIGSPGCS
eukprot:GHVT01045292.1.p1 GENE.GHVT01045292.1~~GHVT01045292.1.p1  ORF type:complete len:1058 (-),score=119.95 GHVT01045292.1:2133-5306(-)